MFSASFSDGCKFIIAVVTDMDDIESSVPRDSRPLGGVCRFFLCTFPFFRYTICLYDVIPDVCHAAGPTAVHFGASCFVTRVSSNFKILEKFIFGRNWAAFYLIFMLTMQKQYFCLRTSFSV